MNYPTPEKLSAANLRAARDLVLNGEASPLFVALLRGYDFEREAHDRDGVTLVRLVENIRQAAKAAESYEDAQRLLSLLKTGP